jgi:hypothetical protein
VRFCATREKLEHPDQALVLHWKTLRFYSIDSAEN